ncbi:MAG: hypothetical protein A2Z25_20975 [Planctomycetes bacterium RBG_16_55_9]|nr:MAG: hypothetical protein A2Z25_20975 [Planctomycetes bacterium RBG_16_55_9]
MIDSSDSYIQELQAQVNCAFAGVCLWLAGLMILIILVAVKTATSLSVSWWWASVPVSMLLTGLFLPVILWRRHCRRFERLRRQFKSRKNQ